MKINDELTKKIAKLAAEIMYSAEKEGEVRSQGEADFVNQHVDNIEVVDNRDEKLGKVEEPKEKKAEKEVKKESYCEDEEMEETKVPDEEMKEATGKLNSYVVFKDSAKKDHKIYGEFIGNEENNTAVISISGKGYTLPKQDVHQSASGMNESLEEATGKLSVGDKVQGIQGVDGGYSGKVKSIKKDNRGSTLVTFIDDKGKERETFDFNVKKLTEATEKISSDIWISELGNVLARAETKDLAMAFEAWANSYYKTPVWQSLVNNPLLKNLFDTMAESLDIFIGTSNEERDAKMDNAEEMEESMPSRSYRDLPDEKLKALAQERGMPGMQAKRVLADREKAAKDGKSTYGTDPVRSALNKKKGMMESSKYVINIEGKIYSEKGKAVEFDDMEKAEKAVAKIKGHSSMTGKEVKVDTLNEESDTEIAAIEKEYLAAKDKKAVLKKYDITSGISRLRPGEIKLGIRNELNGRTSFAALDTDGKLIIISGTEKAPKIRYVKEVMKKEEETSASAIALPDVRLFSKEKK